MTTGVTDFTYSEGCGCQVTFIAESAFHTSRFIPGSHCTSHVNRPQLEARELLIERAHKALSDFNMNRPLYERIDKLRSHIESLVIACEARASFCSFEPYSDRKWQVRSGDKILSKHPSHDEADRAIESIRDASVAKAKGGES